jgi:hypothetical protein
MSEEQYTPTEKDLARFWSKVDKRGDDECWKWQGFIKRTGHGQFKYKSTNGYAHRMSWIIHYGTIPDGLFVCHLCDEPSCVNPNHLFLGTPLDNGKDRAKKGHTRLYRSPIPINKPQPAPLERFWSKVNKRDENQCWNWESRRRRDGYGDIRWNGSHQLAHRVSWEIHCGPIPDDMCILHKCDNRSCVNPHHLFLGTRGDNNRDRENKGRGNQPKGEQSGRVKLTWKQVHEIRYLYTNTETSYPKLARQYNVSHVLIGHIVRGKIWKE